MIREKQILCEIESEFYGNFLNAFKKYVLLPLKEVNAY
jgi:hypothetical protein